MAQPGSGSSRTPFDNDLVNDPQSPRDTQPLTPHNATPSGAPQAGAPQVPGGIPPSAAPVNASRHLPPQVVTRGHNDDTTPHAVPTGPLTKRLPTSTLVGFALAGGAVGVLLLSMIVRSILPGPKNQVVYTPEGAPPPAPRVVMQPPADRNNVQSPQSSDFANRSVDDMDLPAADITIESQTQTSRDRTADGDNASRANRSRSRASAGDSDDDRSTSNNTGTGTRSSQLPDERDTGEGNSSSASSSSSREIPSQFETSSSSSAQSEGRYSSRRGYAITPPDGYTLRSSGRRTVWRGPAGEQILVETGDTNGTPREGWERLDKALSKKYGSKYRSRGIRETTLAGKPAAVWEFEIDTPSGTQRKIDIAVHHKGRGYAVLGQAPAQRFEYARPRIEAAIRSFELQQRRSETSRGDASHSNAARSEPPSTRPSARSAPQRDDSDTSTRGTRPATAPRTEVQNRSNSSTSTRREAAPEPATEDAPPVRSEGY
jgi:hypothetical protein